MPQLSNSTALSSYQMISNFSRCLLGCKNQVRSLSSKNHPKDIDSHIPHPGEGCQNEDTNTKDKNKIKSLQTSIHKNLLKLFHKLKDAKPGSVMPDRKEFTNFETQPGGSDLKNKQVSTGVPLSKVRDGIRNAPQSQDISNGAPTLNAIDKVVDKVLPNMSAVLNNSDKKQHADLSEDGSGYDMESKQVQKSSKDPYAAIAAGPDHPKLPPDLKIAPGSEGEAPSVVPVGMSDEGKGASGNNAGHSSTSEGKY